MARIAPLEPPYEESLGAVLESLMPPGMEPLRLFRTLARNPRVLEKIRAGNLLDRGSIERRDRELAILRTCARCGSEYEWGVHVHFFAARVGLSGEQTEGTLRWAWADLRWSPREQAILRLVDELHETSGVSAELWTGLQEHFEAEQIVELLVLVGFYHTISFVTNALEIEPEEGAARFPAPARLFGDSAG